MESKIDHIIARVLNGEATSEDILLLSNWMDNNKQNKEEFTRIKNYWDAEVNLKQFATPTFSLEKLEREINKRRKIRYRSRYMAMTAAAAALLIIFVTAIYSIKGVTTQEFYTYLSGNSRADFTLYDGTKITLNKNSSLSYSDLYNKENRHVKLEGEAFFDVTKNPVIPFEITIKGKLHDASIKVLETTFSVRYDAETEQVITTLAEGIVMFQGAEQTVKMYPNQQLTYSFATNNIQIKEVRAEDEIAWKDGLIKYQTITLSDLISKLEEHYNTKIIIQNSKLKNSATTVSGTFSEEQTLEQVLEVISRSLPIKWSQQKGVYYIK